MYYELVDDFEQQLGLQPNTKKLIHESCVDVKQRHMVIHKFSKNVRSTHIEAAQAISFIKLRQALEAHRPQLNTAHSIF